MQADCFERLFNSLIITKKLSRPTVYISSKFLALKKY